LPKTARFAGIYRYRYDGRFRVMGGGASTAKPGGGLATIGARLRTNTAEADKLFGGADGGDKNKKISIVNIYDEVQRHGQELKAYWTLETIAEVLAKYDGDHDGLISKSEFLAALNDMEANVEAYHGPQSPLKKKILRAKSAHPKSKTKAPSGTSSKGKLSFMPRSPLSFVPLSPLRWPPQREWTFKKYEKPKQDPVTLTLPGAATSAAGSSGAGGSSFVDVRADMKKAKSILDELDAMEVPIETRRKQFWDRMETLTNGTPRGVWQVSMRNKSGPWDADGVTGMLAAIAHARRIGLTPLLIDNTSGARVDKLWLELCEVKTPAPAPGIVVEGVLSIPSEPLEPPPTPIAQLVEATAMFMDEKLGTRTRALIIKETRRQVVEAMRLGQTLYVRLRDKAVDFTHYSDDEVFHWGTLFDQRIVNELDKFTKGTEAFKQHQSMNTIDNHGLYGEKHPLAMLIREGDLDYEGNFFVGAGFGVVMLTTMAKDVYVENLRNSFAMMRFQPIQPQ
jgi:hypothetical protein